MEQKIKEKTDRIAEQIYDYEKAKIVNFYRQPETPSKKQEQERVFLGELSFDAVMLAEKLITEQLREDIKYINTYWAYIREELPNVWFYYTDWEIAPEDVSVKPAQKIYTLKKQRNIEKTKKNELLRKKMTEAGNSNTKQLRQWCGLLLELMVKYYDECKGE